MAVTETGNSEVISFSSPSKIPFGEDRATPKSDRGKAREIRIRGQREEERERQRDRERGGGRESNLVSSPENMGLFKRLGGIGE